MIRVIVGLAFIFIGGCVQAEPRVDQTAGRYYGERSYKHQEAMDQMLRASDGSDPVIYYSPEEVEK